MLSRTQEYDSFDMAAEVQSAKDKAGSFELRAVIESTPGLIHTGQPDGCLDFFNQTWLTYVGKPLEALLGWRWTAFIHPDDVEGIVEKWRASLASGEPFLYEARVLRADGKFRWMLHHKVAIHNQQGEIVKWHGSSIDIEDRKRAEEALQFMSRDLQESKARLEEAQRITHVGYWEWDLETDRVTWADETYRIYGLQPQERSINLAEIREMIHPEDRGFVFRTAEEAIRGGLRTNAEHRVVRPSGEVRVIHSQGDVRRDASGRPYQMFGTVQDITDRNRAEEALRSSEAYLAEAQRLSHTGSFGWKPDSGELVWSDETYRIFVYDCAEKPNLNMVLQRIHPHDRALAQQVIDRASQAGTDFEHEYRLLLPDGRVKHVHALAHVVQDASGNREFVGAVTEITERKTAEEALRSSEAYLAEAQRLSHTGSWAWTPDTDVRHWSEECYRVLGFDPRDGLPRTEELVQRIHPDDQPVFRESAKRATHNKLDEEIDYRIVHPGGAVRDIHSIGHPVFSPRGDLIEYIGTVIDVTDRKQAEEELRRSEAYLAEAQKLSHTGSWSWTPEDGIRYWSDECYRVL